MTPFDPIALVAMLRAFYPVVSPAAFARARAERPEYFAGGVITRTNGDKLRLPDGRIFDCIINSGGAPGTTFWTANDVTNDPGGPVDPFALEDGPLAPIDEALVIIPPSGESFEQLVSGELEGLGASDDVLHQAAAAVTEFGGAAALDAAWEREMVPAIEQHQAALDALDANDITSELEAAEAHGATIDGAETEYDENPPADLPEPDPGDPPGDGEKPPPEF